MADRKTSSAGDHDYRRAPGCTRSGITIGQLQVSKLDVRETWEKLKQRPIYCHECGSAHVYDMEQKELRCEEHVETTEHLAMRLACAEQRASELERIAVTAQSAATRFRNKVTKLELKHGVVEPVEGEEPAEEQVAEAE